METSLHLSKDEDCSGHSSWMLEKAIDLMKSAFNSLKVEKAKPCTQTITLGCSKKDTEGESKAKVPGTSGGTTKTTAIPATPQLPTGMGDTTEEEEGTDPSRNSRKVLRGAMAPRIFPDPGVKLHGRIGQDISTNRAQIHIVQTALDEVAADWVVDLYDSDALELELQSVLPQAAI